MTTKKRFLARGYPSLPKLRRHIADIVVTETEETLRYEKHKMYDSLFQITKLMHNSFILQQYICYITILNMFRAAPCSSSGGQIVLLQPLVSSLSVKGCTV